MSLPITAKSEAALEVVLTPSSIPPAPESGAETLRPSQVLTVAAGELDWLYENTDDETDPICIQAQAAIEGWLAELSPRQRLAIALQHVRLEIGLEREGPRGLKAHARRARWLFEEALRAYAEVRGRLPSVVPEASSGFSSSLCSSDFEAAL